MPETRTPAAVDQVVVQRILSGDNLAANAAERREVVRRWAETGRPLNDLARLTGWKPERYISQTPTGTTSTPVAVGPRPAAGAGGEAAQQPANGTRSGQNP